MSNKNINIENLVRPNIRQLKPYTCARDMYSEGILLDANENSIGSSATGYESLNLNRYPDPHQNDLKHAVGNYFSINAENLFFGVGSDEIIDLLIRIFCIPQKDSVMILDPTYGMYQVASDINDVKTISVNLNRNFQIDFDAIKDKYNDSVKIIFLCSPNNPTGSLINASDILSLCDDFNAVIVVDEAYIDFAGDNSLINKIVDYPNLVILRTFSKAWGLAGIRLGFCVADKLIINILFKVKAPYNISSLTRSVIFNAIENSKLKDEFIACLKSERERVSAELKKIPRITEVFHSDANYILFRCTEARRVQKEMADNGIVIRDRSAFTILENCLRVSIGTKEENDKFLYAIRSQL